MSMPNFRLLMIFQAILFTGFGLILKDLDDTFGDKLLWTGIAVLAFFILEASYKLINKNSRGKESV